MQMERVLETAITRTEEAEGYCRQMEHTDGDEENFTEWLEHLELVASTCHWDDQAKLVNVATRLRVSASRFYSSCML